MCAFARIKSDRLLGRCSLANRRPTQSTCLTARELRFSDLAAAGLDFPFGIDVDDGNIYVVSQKSNEVYAYLRSLTETIRLGVPSTPHPSSSLLVPEGSGGLTTPFYTTVADGMLYVSSYGTDEVLRYDAETGEFIDVAVAAGEGGLSDRAAWTSTPRAGSTSRAAAGTGLSGMR